MNSESKSDSSSSRRNGGTCHEVPEAAPSLTERRRSGRIPIPGVLIALEAPVIALPLWVTEAVDICESGLGMVMPPELLPGVRVLLSFSLDSGEEFSHLPAGVIHREVGVGAVEFSEWSEPDLQRLQKALETVH